MDLAEALEKASQILEEEQLRPTLGYRSTSNDTATSMLARLDLIGQRNKRPRTVSESPSEFAFKSTNFDLLMKLSSYLASSDTAAFISGLLEHVRNPLPVGARKEVHFFPSLYDRTSALALVAEFCIRTGHLNELLAASSEPKFPTVSLAIMLIEIEEIIALNFNIFSERDLAFIPAALATLRETADRQTHSAHGHRGGPMIENLQYKPGLEKVGTEIVQAIDAINEECAQARYWYLKGALQELPNMEIQNDKLSVESFLVKLGFSADIVRALNAAENDYKSTTSTFALKSSLGHLRSVLEHMHRESAKSVAAAAGQSVVDRWGDATSFLRVQNFISKQHEAFATALYALLSDESVHALTAEREVARLLRNMVIEYGVMFLTMLDKRGVKI